MTPALAKLWELKSPESHRLFPPGTMQAALLSAPWGWEGLPGEGNITAHLSKQEIQDGFAQDHPGSKW